VNSTANRLFAVLGSHSQSWSARNIDAHTFTTQPVAATWGVDPEFVDLRGLEARFSIKRSAAYTLISQNLIRSVVLRRKGTIKGRRLVDVESVRSFLASQPSDVDPQLSANCRKANRARREKAKG
jgi:hypothetical protein